MYFCFKTTFYLFLRQSSMDKELNSKTILNFCNMNKKISHLFIVFFCLFNDKEIFAQLSINTTTSPTQLVEKVLLGYGLKASNITFTGNSNLSKASFVYKDVVGATNLGLSKGVLLSTGNVLDAIGPNLNIATGVQGSGIQDKQMMRLF